MTEPGSLRASDADRERTVRALGEHFAAGRLDLVEFDDRTRAAYAVRRLAELDRLVADLPSTRVAAMPERAPRAAARWSERAGPWASWALTGLICMAIWAATSLSAGEPLGFWPGWVIGPWGLVLLSKSFGGTVLCARRT